MKTGVATAVLLGAIAFLTGGCSGPPGLDGEIRLTQDPSGRAPLTAVLEFSTDRPARVHLAIDNGDLRTEVTPTEAFRTQHSVPILGVGAGKSVVVEVILESESGKKTSTPQSVSFTTPALPDDFPPIEVRISRPARMEAGYTLVPFMRWPGNRTDPDHDFGLIVAVDAQGEIVWYYQADHGLDEPRRTGNGTLVYGSGRAGLMYEIDMLGNVVRQWHSTDIPKDVDEGSIAVKAESFHHDMDIKPDGNLFILTTEVRQMDWPQSPAPNAEVKMSNVIGDVLLEVEAETGEVLRSWNFWELLDPQRRGFGSFRTGFYAETYKDVLDEPGYDWTHMNAVTYLPEEDAVIASSNFMCALFKLDLASGELEWILGRPDGWREPWSDLLLEPVGEMSWFCSQHSPEMTPQGTLLLFDNGGSFPPVPPAPDAENYSRVVEYSIDEEAGTVEEIWSYGAPPGEEDFFLSPFISEADTMSRTGNILVVKGGQMHDADGNPTSNFGAAHHWVTITEVTHTTPVEKVWEIVIDDPRSGWASYRAERVPSLYLGGRNTAPSEPSNY